MINPQVLASGQVQGEGPVSWTPIHPTEHSWDLGGALVESRRPRARAATGQAPRGAQGGKDLAWMGAARCPSPQRGFSSIRGAPDAHSATRAGLPGPLSPGLGWRCQDAAQPRSQPSRNPQVERRAAGCLKAGGRGGSGLSTRL